MNPTGMPDGSATYGLLFNSKAPAIGGFGAGPNNDENDGTDLTINNVDIFGLRLEANELPIIYFDKCTDPNAATSTIQKGPYGDIFDIRQALSDFDAALVDLHSANPASLSEIEYVGNVVADAQIALSQFCDSTSRSFCFLTTISPELSNWAFDSVANPFPSQCADIICNGDIMFHTNKGIMGARIDGIENTQIIDMTISDLVNSSPLVSNACGSYEGPQDGGSPGQEPEGGMGTDVRGLIISRGDVEIIGAENSVSGLNSFYGDIVGVDIINGAIVDYDIGSDIAVSDLVSASQLTDAEYQELIDLGKSPLPNNFDKCSVEVEDGTTLEGMIPYLNEATDCVDGKDLTCIDYGFELVDGLDGGLEEVSVASDGTVYGTNAGDKVYSYDGTTFTHIGGDMEQVDVGSADLVYGVNPQNKAYKYNPTTGTATLIPTSFKGFDTFFQQISVGSDGFVAGVEYKADKANNKVFRIEDDGSLTRLKGKRLAQVSVGSATNIWGVRAGGRVFKYNNNGGWIHIPSEPLKQVSVGADGTVVGINAEGEVFEYDEGVVNFRRVCGSLSYVEVGSSSQIYGVDDTGAIYRATSV